MEPAMLQCIICPGSPCFSDTSHLLTHISSKAHLSYYFKLQVRSHQEDDAVGLLIQYDHWFNTNNLAQLLSDRSTTKEDKRKKRKFAAQANPQLTANNHRPPPSTFIPAEPVPHSPHARLFAPGSLDPRLVVDYGNVKLETNSQASFVSSWYTSAADVVADTPLVSSAAFGTGSSQTVDPARANEWYDYASYNVDEGNPTATLPETPIASRIRFRHSDGARRLGNKASTAFVDARTRTETLDDVEAEKERAEEMSRLKGVLWPGMDIFDSATQLMRRKRNQKKDGKVLKMMEKTSSQVEPTELIFSPTGTLKKQRLISGNVDDDSPLKGETPVPKRRQPRPKTRIGRNALRQTDPNVPRAQDRRRAKKALQVHEPDEEWHEESPSIRQLARLKSVGPSYAPEDDDFVLSAKAFGKRPRKGFAVFADDEHDDKQSFQDQLETSKAPMGTLTPARLVLNSKSTAKKNGHQTDQGSWNKENIEPILDPQGRIDLPSWNNSPFLNRRDANDAMYPRYFLDQPRASDLSNDHDHKGLGFCSNPLLAPFAQMDFYDDNPFEVNDLMSNTGWATVTRSASSEATVSQEDPQELARLYLTGNTD